MSWFNLISCFRLQAIERRYANDTTGASITSIANSFGRKVVLFFCIHCSHTWTTKPTDRLTHTSTLPPRPAPVQIQPDIHHLHELMHSNKDTCAKIGL